MRGKNIVVLLPQSTANGAFGKRYLSKVANIYDVGQVQFKNFPANLPTPVSLVYLLQPNFRQCLHNYRRLKNTKKPDEQAPKAEWFKSRILLLSKD